MDGISNKTILHKKRYSFKVKIAMKKELLRKESESLAGSQHAVTVLAETNGYVFSTCLKDQEIPPDSSKNRDFELLVVCIKYGN